MKKSIVAVLLISSALMAQDSNVEPKTFLPDISLIIDSSMVYRNIQDSAVRHLEIPDVAHGLIGTHTHAGISHASYNANRGFDFNYAELAFSSSVDPFFTMDAVFHLTQSTVEVEEGYVTTSALEHGFQFKAGKFFSDIGRHNNGHHHVWSFADAPLLYDAFLGLHGLNEIGGQLNWLAPTPIYLLIGTELLQGDNIRSFGNRAIGSADAPLVQESSMIPSLATAYVKSSLDIGDTTLLAGSSFLYGATRIDNTTLETPYAIAGKTAIFMLDLTLKHSFDSYSSLTWQSEYLARDIQGVKYVQDGNSSFPASALSSLLSLKQSGWYTQLVYAMDSNWQMGLRMDRIQNQYDKYSAMLSYAPSEFSKIRLQYNNNKALFDESGVGQDIHTVLLQLNMTIGAHKAHAY